MRQVVEVSPKGFDDLFGLVKPIAFHGLFMIYPRPTVTINFMPILWTLKMQSASMQFNNWSHSLITKSIPTLVLSLVTLFLAVHPAQAQEPLLKDLPGPSPMRPGKALAIRSGSTRPGASWSFWPRLFCATAHWNTCSACAEPKNMKPFWPPQPKPVQFMQDCC